MNVGLFFALIFLLFTVCISKPVQGTQVTSQMTRQMTSQTQVSPQPTEIQVIVSEDYTDTLKNVYAPPVQYREAEFRQIGYLTNHHRLPLFGRILNRRDKWAYYTLEQGIKLPIEFNRRKCTQSPGCDSLSTGDEVLVEGVPYRVEMYESFLYSSSI